MRRRLRKQPFQLSLLSPKGVDDIDCRLFHALRPMLCAKHTLILGQDARGRAAMPTDLADLYRKNADDCRHNLRLERRQNNREKNPAS
jgi:hypothetical protein